MSSGENIERTLDEFGYCVEDLSNAVNDAGVDWNDEQYQALSQCLEKIAIGSGSVINSCCDFIEALSDFNRAAREG